MIVDWKYDVSEGGEVEIEAADSAGMPADQVEQAIYAACMADARRSADAYVPSLDDAVAEIMAANEEAGDEE